MSRTEEFIIKFIPHQTSQTGLERSQTQIRVRGKRPAGPLGSRDEPVDQDSADSAGSGATTAEPLAAVLSRDLKGKEKGSQASPAPSIPAASPLPKQKGSSLATRTKEKTPNMNTM